MKIKRKSGGLLLAGLVSSLGLLPSLAAAEAAPNLKVEAKYQDIIPIPLIIPGDKGSPSGKVRWAYNGIDAAISTSPTVGSDGTIYLGAENKRLYAINPDGTKKWDILLADIVYFTVLGSDDMIYAASADGKVYAIDPAGRQKWEFAREGPLVARDYCSSWSRYRFKSPAVGGDDTVFAAGVSGLYAIHPDGTKKWLYAIEAKEQIATPEWHVKGNEAASPAVGADGTIYIGTKIGDLYAIKPNGEKKWTFRAKGSGVYIPPVLGADGTIYVKSFSSGGDSLYALNPDGSIKWSSDTKTYSKPAVGADGTLYIWSDMKLLAYNPDGTVKWGMDAGKPFLTNAAVCGGNQPLFSTPAVGADGTVYVATAVSDWFYAIDPRGKVQWQYYAKGFGGYSPAVGTDGTVYMVSPKTLYALGTDATSVSLNKNAIDLQAGASEVLKAAIIPDAALNKRVIWSSSESTVAEVDSNGRVTGKKPGMAKIIVKTEDGEFTAICDVTVTGTPDEKSPSPDPVVESGLKLNKEVIAPNLTDISGHLAYEEIAKAVAYGFVNGYEDGTFRPDAGVTRAEFATMLMKGMKPAVEGAPLSFADKDQIGTWAVHPVAQAVQLGIISGYEDGTFRPNANITHAEMIAMVVRSSGQPADRTHQTGFADDADIPAWAKPFVSKAEETGIIIVGGLPGNQFAPQVLTTRAEAASAIIRMLMIKR
ncbi:hypothetical protein FE784_25840 [Paenibacillus hemerocallicola]|uniref:SLH domain-containing protein n=1 Tax=Paenibacillus hemerocallicola TaxID=1172614 RepID=A0A5C4T2Q3_9BACL|nr:S-layer homology domain-containing protein [Paenibacillus hemerocallicola]TNJ63344.1 hypothetical protein FE784_25840 [Paenibacillus hemerocallicola]